MKRLAEALGKGLGFEKPEEVKREKTAEEKRIEEMEVCGQKLVDQIWNESRFGLASDLAARVKLIDIMARYLQGNGLEQYVKQIAVPIETRLSKDPDYADEETLDLARLKIELALSLQRAGRPCRVELEPQHYSSFSHQHVLLAERALWHARSSDEAVQAFIDVSGVMWTKQELVEALQRYSDRTFARDTRMVVGKEIGPITRFMKLDWWVSGQLNEGHLDKEKCCELAQLLDGYDLFDRPIFHLIARIMLEHGVARTLAMSDDGRSLREPFHRIGFKKCLPFVQVLAEQGGFAELLSLRHEEPWWDIYRARPVAFYDPILIELAKREAGRVAVPLEAASSRGAFRTNVYAPQAIDTVKYWLDLWQREADGDVARLPLPLADGKLKNQQFFLAQTFARMALSVPAKHAAAYLDQAEAYRARVMSMADVDFVDTETADIHMSSLTALFNQVRAYVRPDSLDLTSIQPISLQKTEHFAVFETGLLLLRQAKKMRLALEKAKT